MSGKDLFQGATNAELHQRMRLDARLSLSVARKRLDFAAKRLHGQVLTKGEITVLGFIISQAEGILGQDRHLA